MKSILVLCGLIVRPTALTQDESGRVYIYDDGRHRIISFDRDGKLLWSSGDEGQAPGQLNGPTDISYDGEAYLYLSNQFGTRLDRYTIDGDFDTSWPIQDLDIGRARIAGFLEDGRLVLFSALDGSYGANVFIVSVGERLIVESSFEINLSSGSDGEIQMSGMPSIRTAGNEIAVSHGSLYRFTTYDSGGNILTVIERPSVRVLQPIVRETSTGPRTISFTTMIPPFQIDGGYWLVGGMWPNNLSDPLKYFEDVSKGIRFPLEYDRRLDLYDGSGRWLYGLDTDAIDHHAINRIFDVSSAGEIYALTDNGASISRIKLVIRGRAN